MIIVLVVIVYAVVVLTGIGMWAWRNIRDSRIPTPAPGESLTIFTTGWVLVFLAGDTVAFAMTGAWIVLAIRADAVFSIAVTLILIAATIYIHKFQPLNALLKETIHYVLGKPTINLSHDKIVDLRYGETIFLADYESFYTYRKLLRLTSMRGGSSMVKRIIIHGIRFRENMAVHEALKNSGLEWENERSWRSPK